MGPRPGGETSLRCRARRPHPYHAVPSRLHASRNRLRKGPQMAEAAIPILLGGAASALGSYFGAQATANAAKQSAALQQQRFNQVVGYEQPYMQSGQNALNLYDNAIGANGSAAQQSYYNNFQNDPGFQASTNYGLQQIQAQNAAQGIGLSGNLLAALQSYSQNALSQQ